MPAVEIEKVEGVEDQPVAGALRQRVLQQREAGDALVVERNDLAVDDRLLARQLGKGLRQVAIALRPVEAAARDQADLADGNMGGGAVAVELDLVDPAMIVLRRRLCRGG